MKAEGVEWMMRQGLSGERHWSRDLVMRPW